MYIIEILFDKGYKATHANSQNTMWSQTVFSNFACFKTCSSIFVRIWDTLKWEEYIVSLKGDSFRFEENFVVTTYEPLTRSRYKTYQYWIRVRHDSSPFLEYRGFTGYNPSWL